MAQLHNDTTDRLRTVIRHQAREDDLAQQLPPFRHRLGAANGESSGSSGHTGTPEDWAARRRGHLCVAGGPGWSSAGAALTARREAGPRRRRADNGQ